MTIRKLLLLAALPAAVAFVGCGPNTNGTGGSKTDVTKPDGGKATVDESYKLEGPGSVSLKQGETKNFEFKVGSKGKEFKSDVDVTTEGGDKLTVKAVPAKVPASGDGKFSVVVTAPDDAPLAEQTIKLTGKADKGNPAVAEFKVKVDKK